MRIGVLGTGNMADALATHWVRAGHEVFIGGRDEPKARGLAGRVGGGAGTGVRTRRHASVRWCWPRCRTKRGRPSSRTSGRR